MKNPILPRILIRATRGAYEFLAAFLMVIPILGMVLTVRLFSRNRVGLGPEPLINNVHHARALRLHGYDVMTFVNQVYYITQEFDVRMDRFRPWNHYALFWRVVSQCRVIYIYFNGGPLGWTPLRGLEPLLLRCAGVRVVALAYGGDVQNFAAHDDVVYRAAYLKDYPDFIRRQMRTRAKQVARWCQDADWVVSGCDWVHYMPHWNSLMLTHFSVDTDQWSPPTPDVYQAPARCNAARPLRIVHAPNHRAIKGTKHIQLVVEELQAAGIAVELILIEKMPNDHLREVLRRADVIVEQLVIGWHGIFALEAMALGKPVLTYIDPELERLYILSGLLRIGELPILKVDHLNLATELSACADGGRDLGEIGRRSREYVERHHSLNVIGAEFARINLELGLPPSRPKI